MTILSVPLFLKIIYVHKKDTRIVGYENALFYFIIVFNRIDKKSGENVESVIKGG